MKPNQISPKAVFPPIHGGKNDIPFFPPLAFIPPMIPFPPKAHLPPKALFPPMAHLPPKAHSPPKVHFPPKAHSLPTAPPKKYFPSPPSKNDVRTKAKHDFEESLVDISLELTDKDLEILPQDGVLTKKDQENLRQQPDIKSGKVGGRGVLDDRKDKPEYPWAIGGKKKETKVDQGPIMAGGGVSGGKIEDNETAQNLTNVPPSKKGSLPALPFRRPSH